MDAPTQSQDNLSPASRTYRTSMTPIKQLKLPRILHFLFTQAYILKFILPHKNKLKHETVKEFHNRLFLNKKVLVEHLM
jgi:hypothetical protein